jgi:hypothetical protein
MRAALTIHGFYTTECKAARRQVAAVKAETRAALVRRRAAGVIAETRALLVLHRAGAHPADAIASHRLRVVGDMPAGGKARRGGSTLGNVRKVGLWVGGSGDRCEIGCGATLAATPRPNLGPLCGPSPQGEGESL